MGLFDQLRSLTQTAASSFQFSKCLGEATGLFERMGLFDFMTSGHNEHSDQWCGFHSQKALLQPKPPLGGVFSSKKLSLECNLRSSECCLNATFAPANVAPPECPPKALRPPGCSRRRNLSLERVAGDIGRYSSGSETKKD